MVWLILLVFILMELYVMIVLSHTHLSLSLSLSLFSLRMPHHFHKSLQPPPHSTSNRITLYLHSPSPLTSPSLPPSLPLSFHYKVASLQLLLLYIYFYTQNTVL